jgi:ribonuclease D
MTDDLDPSDLHGRHSILTHAELAPTMTNDTEAPIDPQVELIADGSNEPVALDTEADSFHHYYEKVCLIQLAVGDRVFLVDPLSPPARLNLAPLISRLSARLLLLHGADYDLRLLRRTFGFHASSIFDTMIAAQLVGESEIGLAALLSRRLSVTLDKTNQRADWSERPISRDRIAYAAGDVLHLSRLVEGLRDDLVSRGRHEWHAEECARLVVSPFTAKESDPETEWRLKGSNALSSRERAFLRALWLAREERAREIDRPPFRVLTNERLLAAARLAGGGEMDLTKLFPSSRPLPSLVVSKLRQALEAARAIPASEWPGPRRGERTETDPALEKAIDALKLRRDASARTLGLDPGILASRSVLALAARAVLRNETKDPGRIAEETGISRWRAELLFGG